MGDAREAVEELFLKAVPKSDYKSVSCHQRVNCHSSRTAFGDYGICSIGL